MKTILFSILMFVCTSMSAQSITYDQARLSKDPRIVATFIKANPNHPQTVELKQHLIDLINSGATASPAPSYSGTANYSKSGSSSSSYSGGGTAAHKKNTVDLLNHLFNSDPSAKDAYVQITNNSKCNVEMRITGRRSYSMMIPAKKQNYILVDKGTYTFSSMICDAKYQSVKAVSKDLMITLNR